MRFKQNAPMLDLNANVIVNHATYKLLWKV